MRGRGECSEPRRTESGSVVRRPELRDDWTRYFRSPKLTWISVLVAMGLPLSMAGLYFHRITAVRALPPRITSPERTITFLTSPCSSIVAVRRTTPKAPRWRARAGYSGLG